MKPLPVIWGWRIRCITPGCTCAIEVEREAGEFRTGPPEIYVEKSFLDEGWFFKRIPGSWSIGSTYIALCPEHGEMGRKWQRDKSAWDRARAAEAKAFFQRKKTAYERMYGLWDAMMSREPQYRTRQHMAEWCRENPAPRAPWKNVFDG